MVNIYIYIYTFHRQKGRAAIRHDAEKVKHSNVWYQGRGRLALVSSAGALIISHSLCCAAALASSTANTCRDNVSMSSVYRQTG